MIDTTARPVVRAGRQQKSPENDQGPETAPRRAVTSKQRVIDPFEQSIPGVALFDGAFSGAVPAVVLAPERADVSREQLGLGKRIANWRTIVPMAIILVLLVLAIKSFVTGFDLSKVGKAIAEANLFYLAIAFIAFYASFVVRVVRWRALLDNVGMTRDTSSHMPHFGKLFEILYLSWFANSVVPAKLGDVYRAYLLKQEANVSGTRSFGTILAERLLDFIVLLVLFVVAALFNFRQITANLHPGVRATLLFGLIAIFVLIVAGIAMLVILRVYREPIRSRIPERFQTKYDDFQAGTLGSFRRLPMLLIMTVTVWLCETTRFYFASQSVGLLPADAFWAAMFVALGESLLTVVPFTSGGIGIVEAGMLAMLLVFVHGPNAQNSSAAAIVLDRMISLGSVLVFGGILYLLVFVRNARKQTINLSVAGRSGTGPTGGRG
jgi:glycosyltransferase 2 family protein